MITRPLQPLAVEKLLEALREVPVIVCTWCGERMMTPQRAFVDGEGWALQFRCDVCRGEHLEHAGMWPRPALDVRTDRTHGADNPGGGGGGS